MLIFGTIGMLFAFMWFISWLRSTPAQYRRDDTDFYSLPIASHAPVNLLFADRVTIEDRSSYAGNEILALYQYVRYLYDDDILLAVADYDEDGSLFQWTVWEYDTAGNIRKEQT